ncbi:MAG: type II toxin-antitoxin system HigB family toxin [Chloroflexota bacterium]|nr:type II toxin-antitoxin system HigB family toxin [Chloroflexota bacterium]
MRIIAKRTLREFWENPDYHDAEQPLKAWYAEAAHADWRTPVDVKEKYGNASIVGNNRVVFNIAGNKYRLVIKFHYNTGIGYVRFVGTHKEYDRIDVEVV